jgi:hypothetical protein
LQFVPNQQFSAQPVIGNFSAMAPLLCGVQTADKVNTDCRWKATNILVHDEREFVSQTLLNNYLIKAAIVNEISG